jgi:16S rRNA (cytosine967-C5)-methyltransferase
LGIAHSHPTWLVQRWLGRWNEGQVARLLASNNSTPPLVCAFPHAEGRAAMLGELRRAGVDCEPARWVREAVTITSGARHLGPFLRRGQVQVQDEASQMVAQLLGVRPGHRVLDLCAAPGGKTWALARGVLPGGQVFAADLHLHRLRAMRERLTTAGVTGVHHLALDATRVLPVFGSFDRILVDAPCSGTGTLARNPEIRWRLEPGDLTDLQARQIQLLSRALAKLAPGGRLVYSTCSLEPEENEGVLAAALATHADVRITSVSADLARALRDPADVVNLFDAAGHFRTFPAQHGADGFFAAALEKC